MIDAWINPDLIQNRDPGLLDSIIQGPHLGGDITGGNDVCFAFDSRSYHGCMVGVWNK